MLKLMRLALRLGLLRMGTAALLVASGCGDDGSDGSNDSTTSTTTDDGSETTVSDPTTLMPTMTGGTGTTTMPTTADTGSTDTGTDTGTTAAEESSSSTGPTDCRPLIVEVVANPLAGDDDLHQWVKLYNPCNAAIDFDAETWSLGWSGGPTEEGTYAFGGVDLEGSIAAGGCYLVGGEMSVEANGNPVYDFDVDFAPSLRLAEAPAMTVPGVGLALFDVDENGVDANTIPIDAVVYGENNDNDLIDETGAPVAAPHVAVAPEGGSIQRTSVDATWETSTELAAGTCPPF